MEDQEPEGHLEHLGEEGVDHTRPEEHHTLPQVAASASLLVTLTQRINTWRAAAHQQWENRRSNATSVSTTEPEESEETESATTSSESSEEKSTDKENDGSETFSTVVRAKFAALQSSCSCTKGKDNMGKFCCEKAEKLAKYVESKATGVVPNNKTSKVVSSDISFDKVVTMLHLTSSAQKQVEFHEPVEDSSRWELSEAWKIRTGYVTGIQKGYVKKFSDYEESQKYKWRLVALLLCITIFFLPPIRRAIFGNLWASPDRMCLYRKTKLDQINAIVANGSNAQLAYEQLEFGRMLQNMSSRILHEGYIVTQPDSEPKLELDALIESVHYNENDTATLSSFKQTAVPGEKLLFKMYHNYPHACSSKTLQLLKESASQMSCKVNLTYNDVEDILRAEVKHQLRQVLDEDCEVVSKIVKILSKRLALSALVALLPFGGLCSPWANKIITKQIGKAVNEIMDNFLDWMLKCERLTLRLVDKVLDDFFEERGNEVMVSFPSFCNPATALLATRLQESYESFKELVEQNVDFSPPKEEEQSLLMAILSEQFNLIVIIWSLHKVLRVALALPIQPYVVNAAPLSVSLRKPIVEFSTLKLILLCVVFLNINVLFEGDGYFDNLYEALNYFNEDPCNVLPSFNRERLGLVNATCSRVLKDAAEYVGLQYRLQEQYFQASIYKGCFLDDWDSLSVYGDCPLCQYNSLDFVLCEECTENVTRFSSLSSDAALNQSLVTLREVRDLVKDLYVGRCNEDLFEAFFLDTSNQTMYRHKGFELIFLSGWIPQVLLPVFILHAIFETFAVRWPSSVHSSRIEVTNEKFDLNKEDEEYLRDFVRQSHFRSAVCSYILLFCWLTLVLYTQGLELQDASEAVKAYSYSPPPVLNEAFINQDSLQARLQVELEQLRSDDDELTGLFFCWGDIPEILPNIAGPISIMSASSSAVCGITFFGKGVCFGLNTGDYHPSPRPYDLRPPPQTEPGRYPKNAEAFRDIVVGGTYACGLQNSSLVLCYGFNFPGTVSGSSRQELNLEKNPSIPPFAAIRFDSISSGDYHLCGLTLSTHTLLCYGYFVPAVSTWRLSVDAIVNVRVAVSTYNAMCILDESYNVRCWNYATPGGSGKLMLSLTTSGRFQSNVEEVVLEASSNRFCVRRAEDIACWHEGLASGPDHQRKSKAVNGFIYDKTDNTFNYLFKDGTMTKAPVRAPLVSKVVSTGKTHCGIFY